MAVEWTAELERWIETVAVHAGFDACGVAALGGASQPREALDATRFTDWVDAERSGDMLYLKRRDEAGILLRSAVQVAMPWAKSVLVCATNYNAGGPLSTEPAASTAGWIGRYAWSGRAPSEAESQAGAAGLVATDYHEVLLARLRTIEVALLARASCQTRCYIDTGPIVERSVAARAGIGWVGKNTCMINQQLGSWLLLGVIVTSLPVAAELDIEEAADRCGSCTRCLDACPTGALIAPHQMDASRCIAYLTIEKKGVIPEDLREGVGRQIFGCDICQDVCPWNRRSPIAVREGSIARSELINPALEWLASMDSSAFKRWFKGSPLERTTRKRLLRNVAIAMGNSGDRLFLSQLETWSAGEDQVLAESARWAAARIIQQTPDVDPASRESLPPQLSPPTC